MALEMPNFETVLKNNYLEILNCFAPVDLDFTSPKNFFVQSEKQYDFLCLTMQDYYSLGEVKYLSIYNFLILHEKIRYDFAKKQAQG